MPRKTEIKVSDEDKIIIDSNDVIRFKLPQKAIGIWVLETKSGRYYRLRKVRLDSYLASDKYNNFQNISYRDYHALIISSDDKKFDSLFENVSSRKTEWIKSLISEFSRDPELSIALLTLGKYKIAKYILSDTDKTDGNSKYTSTLEAISYWKRNKERYANNDDL